MGGEKTLTRLLRGQWRGSPPRGRGKACPADVRFRYLGITPAWAGKSLRKAYKGKLRYGSPPRGRGKVSLFTHVHVCKGITPAWAGKSDHWCVKVVSDWDHPRVGGEKASKVVRMFWSRGSPPRGRGKAESFQALLIAVRITPAWAGKSLKRSHRSGIFISGPIPFHSVLHRPAGSGGSRAGRDGSPAGQPQNAGPA